MKVWVDADACPGAVKEIILKAVIKRGISTIFVANKFIELPQNSLLDFKLVAAGPDIADAYIAAQAKPGDLVITQDILLAGDLVEQGIVTISVYGTLFDQYNIGERVSVRNFMQGLRDTGMQTAGPKPFGPKDRQQFANTLDQQLTKLCR